MLPARSPGHGVGWLAANYGIEGVFLSFFLETLCVLGVSAVHFLLS
jgi:hypothetical protein